MKLIAQLLIAITVFACADGDAVITINQKKPQCDPTEVMSNFNSTKFAGNWFLSGYLLRGPSLLRCVFGNWSNNERQENRFYSHLNLRYGFRTIEIPYLVEEVRGSPGLFTLDDTHQHQRFFKQVVLSTDYVNWAILRSCHKPKHYPIGERIWILLRAEPPVFYEKYEYTKACGIEVMKELERLGYFARLSNNYACPVLVPLLFESVWNDIVDIFLG